MIFTLWVVEIGNRFACAGEPSARHIFSRQTAKTTYNLCIVLIARREITVPE
jgi:hypothetical protein